VNSKRVLITGTMRSGTTLINRDVCDSILHVSAKSEITPLMESMSLAARWRKIMKNADIKIGLWVTPCQI
jgi:hypothetical protein